MTAEPKLRLPKSGDVLHVGKAASVQFTQSIVIRVIRVREEWATYDGWAWIDGYELAPTTGTAVRRRTIFVQLAGLRPAGEVPDPAARTRNARIPAQRRPSTSPIRSTR